jgi:hypothetical protein
MCRPAAYVVRVLGVLNDVRVAQHAAVNITVSADLSKPATTALTVTLKDQAHLMSLLMELYELGYPILSVEYLPMQSAPESRANSAVVR